MKKIILMSLLIGMTSAINCNADVVVVSSNGRANYESMRNTPSYTNHSIVARNDFMHNQNIQLSDFDEVVELPSRYLKYKVKKNDKWGLLTTERETKLIIQPIYDTIEHVVGDWYKVSKNKKEGLYFDNDMILDTQYGNITFGSSYREGESNCISYIISKNNKYAMWIYNYDKGSSQLNFKYDDIKAINTISTTGALSYKIKLNKYALYQPYSPYTDAQNYKSEFKSDFIYDDIYDLNEKNRYFVVVKNNKKGLFDAKAKKELTAIKYDDFKEEKGARNSFMGTQKIEIYGKSNNSWEKVYIYTKNVPGNPW